MRSRNAKERYVEILSFQHFARYTISLFAQDRSIGGLGVYVVKKMMDDVEYEYKDGKNIFTIVKHLGAEEESVR